MTNLFLSLIADAQLKRNIYLLKFLAESKDFVTTKKISQKLNVSPLTILTDIDILSKKMPDGIDIIKRKGHGVKLILDEQISIDNYLSSLAQDTVEFKILDGAYKGEVYTIYDLEKNLFASNFYIRQRIKHINSIIKSFKCSLSSYVVNITGEEINIRYFFYFFYLGMRDLFILEPREDKFLDVYEELIQSLKKQNLLKLHLDYRQAANWLEVSKTRLINKSFVKLESKLVKNMTSRHSYQLLAPVFKSVYLSKFNLDNIPEDELVCTYIGSLNCVIYNNLRDKEFGYSLMREEDDYVLEKINIFLDIHLPKFKIDTKRQSESFLVHQAFLVNLKLLSQLTPLFQKKSSLLKNYIIENHESIYLKWLSILKNTKSNELFKMYYLEDISVTMTMLVISIIFGQRAKRTCHVLFSFHGEASYPNYLASVSRSILPENVKCTYIFNQQINNELIEEIGAELFVSNCDYKSKVNCCEIVQLSYVPTIREWNYLKNLVIDKTMIGTFTNVELYE